MSVNGSHCHHRRQWKGSDMSCWREKGVFPSMSGALTHGGVRTAWHSKPSASVCQGERRMRHVWAPTELRVDAELKQCQWYVEKLRAGPSGHPWTLSCEVRFWVDKGYCGCLGVYVNLFLAAWVLLHLPTWYFCIWLVFFPLKSYRNISHPVPGSFSYYFMTF